MKKLSKPHGATLRAARNLAAILTISATCVTSAAAAPKAVGGETAAVAQQLFGKILTKCGESYFYAGSGFDYDGLLGASANKNPQKTEYRGVRFTQVPIRVTESDRLNGIEARARVALIARVYKIDDDGGWLEGPGLQPRNANDILYTALSTAGGDMGPMGISGAIAFELVKFKGTWAVARGSVVRSGPVGTGGHYHELKDVLSSPVPRVDCKTGEIKFQAAGGS
jgi:hypothetical protein